MLSVIVVVVSNVGVDGDGFWRAALSPAPSLGEGGGAAAPAPPDDCWSILSGGVIYGEYAGDQSLEGGLGATRRDGSQSLSAFGGTGRVVKSERISERRDGDVGRVGSSGIGRVADALVVEGTGLFVLGETRGGIVMKEGGMARGPGDEDPLGTTSGETVFGRLEVGMDAGAGAGLEMEGRRELD